MGITFEHPLSALYDGLASPPLTPAYSPSRRVSLPFSAEHTIARSPLTAPTSPVFPSRRVSIPDQPDHPPADGGIPPIILNGSDDLDPRGTANFVPLGSLQPNQQPPPKLFINRRPTLLPIDTDTDSLTRERKGKMPALNHLLSVGNDGRVLSLVADENCVYAGCQSADNEITVFSRTSFRPLFRLLGHLGSVLCLLLIKEKDWLVSSSSAGDIRIWCTKTFQPLYIIHPCDDTAGDIYSLAWDDRAGGTLYFGSQSASIEWVNFATSTPTVPLPARARKPSLPSPSASLAVPVKDGQPPKPMTPSAPRPKPLNLSTPSAQRSGRYRPHAFFDNLPSDCSSGASTPNSPSPALAARRGTVMEHELHRLSINGSTDLSAKNELSRTDPYPLENPSTVIEFEVAVDARQAFSHYGYIYALHLIPRPDGTAWLASGSGDSDIKIWKAEPGGGLTLMSTFSKLAGAVLSFAVRDTLLFAGLQDGQIAVWDLETGACIRTIEAHSADVLSMSVLGEDVYTAAADGRVLRFDGQFDCTAAWRAHSGIAMSSAIIEAQHEHGWELMTAGNDSYVKIWSIYAPESAASPTEALAEAEGDIMLYALSKLVAIPTVSDDVHRESCRQGAHLLKKVLQQLGAQSEVLSGEQGRNPLVLATFQGRPTTEPRKRILFYGHYDVQPAEESDWETDPWTLSGRNGYLYARGVSDNKGPILAVASAAATLRQRRELDVDVVMLIEGEEEAGSRGFAQTVRKHKEAIGHIDVVLLSNSTWVGEEDPCVVYGMRGVLYANLAISSQGEDAHSGVEGGSVAEPMLDMVKILGAMADQTGVKIPHFYDQVRSRTDMEMQSLGDVSLATGKSVDDLAKVWRDPSFSIANISSSGSANKTVIPKKVAADISMRIVPDQDLTTITASLKAFCMEIFASLGSSNHFEIAVTHSASWWLASLDSPYFLALEAAVESVWGTKPLRIREGGTVPTIFWLEKEFGAPCVHLPLGQSSDAGHLANERMRLLNLRNGERVMESFFRRIPSM